MVQTSQWAWQLQWQDSIEDEFDNIDNDFWIISFFISYNDLQWPERSKKETKWKECNKERDKKTWNVSESSIQLTSEEICKTKVCFFNSFCLFYLRMIIVHVLKFEIISSFENSVFIQFIENFILSLRILYKGLYLHHFYPSLSTFNFSCAPSQIIDFSSLVIIS